jgi:hypothetical protein
LSQYTVTPENIAIDVFLDRQRLKDGMDFFNKFSAALVKSKVVLQDKS